MWRSEAIGPSDQRSTTLSTSLARELLHHGTISASGRKLCQTCTMVLFLHS
jgi:hypothetical protein